jgi:plasmid stabilization system protein ParE
VNISGYPRVQAGEDDYTSNDNPDAALALMDETQDRVTRLSAHLKRYRPGRIKGTRELVVRSNYIVVRGGPRF